MTASNIAPILAIDTSGSFCSVALQAGQAEPAHRESSGAGDHFEQLPGLVREVMSECGLSAADLRELRIGLGPGSFTGLRIGMSFAKGLSVAARVALRGIPSFEAVAWAVCNHGAGQQHADILVVSDARRDEVFACAYRWESGRLSSEHPATISPVSFVAEWGKANPKGIIATPLREHGLQGLGEVQTVSRIAEGLLKVECRQEEPFRLHEVSFLEPNYLRAVAAKSIAERGGA